MTAVAIILLAVGLAVLLCAAFSGSRPVDREIDALGDSIDRLADTIRGLR